MIKGCQLANELISKCRALIGRERMLVVVLLALWLVPCAAAEPVQFTKTQIEVPTYIFGRSEIVAPLFKSIESAGFYPYTMLDPSSRSQRPVPVKYECLVLENEYLRAEFLPELGGRIYSAYDKVAKRQLFYHPTVIKPGRYNQRGAWPVGNLELYGPFDAHMLTWPGEPWAWAHERHPDGSATVTLSHIDHIFRDKISLGVTLHPGRAFLELTIRLQNKNLLPNRYLIWTNAGVAVTDGSRFVYPMTQTIGHDSSALSTWPMIGGADLSWNKNNVNMLGVFGLDIFDNFMSIYDYKTDYGTICYTNRLLARGMKTWTFGSGPTAWRQAENYTDNDGIYMETQSGRFIWDGNYEIIDPGKTDGWTEYWFGAGKIGGLTTATRDVAVRFDPPDQRPAMAELSVTATAEFPRAALELFAGDAEIWSTRSALSVGTAFHASIQLPANAKGKQLTLKIRSEDGRPLLTHTFYPAGAHPDAAYASDSIPRKFGPLETLQVEELYQKGLGHEKFGQLADAEAAYSAALARDPLFSPVRVRLGLMAMDRFDYPEAQTQFEKVLERDPTNGDAHYYLGLIFSDMGKRLDAERNFYRILPSSGKFERRDYVLSLLDLKNGNLNEALRKLASASGITPSDLSVRQAYAYALRKTGRRDAAEAEREAILRQDPTNAFAASEGHFGAATESVLAVDQACAHHPQGYLELATEYLRLSAWEEAARVLDLALVSGRKSADGPYPLLFYYRAFAEGQKGDDNAARPFLASAKKLDLKIDIFPFRFEDVSVLRYALKMDAGDVNAAVLLGDLLYSRNRHDEAITLWRKAIESDPGSFFALRDLGLALFIDGERDQGLKLLTRASVARPEHLATTMLLTDTYARLGNGEAARRVLQRALDRQPGRDVLIEKLASIEAQLGNDSRALELLTSHKFEATHQTYSLLHLYRGVRLMMALDSFKKKDYAQALEHVRAAARPPGSLGIDSFATVNSSRLLTFEALLLAALNRSQEARAAWQAAADTRDEEIEGEGLFRAIALKKCGQEQKAREWLEAFPAVNNQRMKDNAVTLRVQANSLAGIYSAFEGDEGRAADCFRRSLEIDQSYLYSRQALAWLEAGLLKGLR